MIHTVNYDGLVGLTHNFAGLGHGNLASQNNQGRHSSPKRAALEGLGKMALLLELGLRQGVLPPHERPNLGFLRACGFEGSDSEVFDKAWRAQPRLAKISMSASSMWVANAATVTRHQGRIHFTPANLSAQLHRAAEVEFTAHSLRQIFSGPSFVHHAPLFSHTELGDEGAANHMTFGSDENYVEVFVYGAPGDPAPSKHRPRQFLAASQLVAARHGVADRSVFLRQRASSIDQGVFHNDVISVNHENLLFGHEYAFEPDELQKLQTAFPSLEVVEVRAEDVSVEDAVKSYLFNSQIVTGPLGRTLIAPRQVDEIESVKNEVRRLSEQGVFADVKVLALDESMRNGGGPACLRLRVPMRDEDLEGVKCLVDASMIASLRTWVEKHYPDRLSEADLQDPTWIDLNRAALDELTQVLGLGGAFYAFQRSS
ncbi:N-succinylarginine dihydrolase [Microvenator marinus]|uniref:N-succinylarginine dihydrolase n=1 Tax=Microvenator marinus TaxID=2600177 RepID=A0A5B8XTG6_9DELT|nr:N-succinylarginine dihydrolase [Microvenator marinus]QED26936.1 N-succinylarginine dihydrolase [Microvenator marinus]